MEEECLNASKRRKIEDTVLQILKTSNLETITEFSVRATAAARVGFELSGLTYRRLVRQLVDSFLLSSAAAILGVKSLNTINDGNSTGGNADYRRELVELDGNYDGKVICKLSDKRMVTIYDACGTNMVAIRDFCVKDGHILPEKGANTGISLTATQWSAFRNSFPSIQEAIVKLELHSRSLSVAKQSEADMTNSVADSATEKNQTEAGISNLSSVVCHPKKRKQNESEADMKNSVADSAAEKSQTQASISNLVGIVRPNSKSEHTEADSYKAVIASTSEEHILVERKQEAADTSGPITISNYQEQMPADIGETESDIPTLVSPLPAESQHETVNAVHPEKLVPPERKQTEADVSTSVPSVPSQGHLHYTANDIRPTQLVPIQAARFDGRNYHSWRHQMEFLLDRLNIAYVLSELCPSISENPEASSEEKVNAKAAVQRWIDDDCMCRHNILSSLCDNLFQLYSKKNCSARELWEELKSAYDDDFGTKRSQINKYIHFQMVDGVPILDQVQELHRIADSIISSGTWIDENFHVSAIISKLPPSWKEFRAKLMQEDFLPLNMLMHRVRVEEESNCYKKETSSKKDNIIEPKLEFYKHGIRKNENKRVVCYCCGKEGHFAKKCPDRKENGVTPPCTGPKIVDAEKTK